MELVDGDHDPVSDGDPAVAVDGPVDAVAVLAGQLNAANAGLVAHVVEMLGTGGWEQRTNNQAA